MIVRHEWMTNENLLIVLMGSFIASSIFLGLVVAIGNSVTRLIKRKRKGSWAQRWRLL